MTLNKGGSTNKYRNAKTSNVVLWSMAICLMLGNGFSQATLQAQEQPPLAQLDLTVNNIKQVKGFLVVRLYNDSESWLSEETAFEERLAITDTVLAEGSNDQGTINLRLDLPQGDYAVSVYHDVNSNGKLDSNFIGIPKEPAAVSNKAPGRFGPPKYEDAKFSLNEFGAEQVLDFK